MGLVDLDHTLAGARHWGELPVDTVVIEVEPAETSFGLGFSDVLAACLDPLLEAVRAEMAIEGEAHVVWDRGLDEPPADAAEASEELDDLRDYARRHAQARRHADRAPTFADTLSSEVPGIALAGRVRPWGVFADCGGDWFDAVPLGDGTLGIVVGDVPGRGVEAAAAMSDLRAAVRAYVVRDGDSPAALVGHVDRLAAATGLGREARLLYLAVQPGKGEVRYCNAGGCPPLLLHTQRSATRFADTSGGAPVGAATDRVRSEAIVRLAPDSTLLLFTDGLVQSPTVSRAAGMERLLRAAVDGPRQLDDLCAHVLGACTGKSERDDDICLVGVRFVGIAAKDPSAAAR